MLITHRAQRVVSVEFIGINLSTFFDAFLHNGHDGFRLNIFNRFGNQVAAAFNHSKDRGFALCASALCISRFLVGVFVLFLAAIVRLIHLDFASQWIDVFRKNVSDFLAHTPSGFISYACFPLDLFGGNTVEALCHCIDHIEPNGQRSRRLVKYGVGGRRDLIPTSVTRVRLASFGVMKQSIVLALWAIYSFWILLVADVIKASIVIWKHLLEVFESKFSHRVFHFGGSLCPII